MKRLRMLRCLSITMAQPAETSVPTFLFESFPDTAVLFELHELRLSFAPVFWNELNVYRNLAALRLCNLSRSRSVDWAAFAATLTQTTDLRLLELSRMDWRDLPTDIPLISLPTLTDLHITFDADVSIMPLVHLRMPSVSLLHLHLLRDNLDCFNYVFRPLLSGIRYLKVRFKTANRIH